jgi:hypothetical protein
MTDEAADTTILDDFRRNWLSFCDCDPFPGAHDFQERMEAAGLIETAAVDDDDLDGSFAAERGLERGGHKWVLTEAGRHALAVDETDTPTKPLMDAFERYRDRISNGEHVSDLASAGSDIVAVPRAGAYNPGILNAMYDAYRQTASLESAFRAGVLAMLDYHDARGGGRPENAVSSAEAVELLEIAATALAPFAEVSKTYPDVYGPGNMIVGDDDRCPVTFLDLHRAAEVSEIISAAVSNGRQPPEHEADAASYWRQEYKGMEMAFMSAKSEYSEVAIAMGFEGGSWFGDPLADHADVVATAKRLHAQNSVGWLFDNEDVGREFSEDHPIESGEVPDATNVVPANAETLLVEMKGAWKLLEENRQTRDELGALLGDLRRENDKYKDSVG